MVKLGNVPPQDEKVVQSALRRLPAQINEAKEKEMGEMMGKLKDVSLILLNEGLKYLPLSSCLCCTDSGGILVGEWYLKAVWALDGQFQVYTGSENGRLQYVVRILNLEPVVPLRTMELKHELPDDDMTVRSPVSMSIDKECRVPRLHSRERWPQVLYF